MDTQKPRALMGSFATLPLPSIRVSTQTNGSVREIRDLWGEEVFETLVGIVLAIHARKGGAK